VNTVPRREHPLDPGGSVYTAALARLFNAATYISPSWWISRWARGSARPWIAPQVYVLSVTVALAGLWLASVHGGVIAAVAVVIAMWRLIEIANVGLALALADPRQFINPTSRIVEVGIYGVQIPLIFSVFLEAFARNATEWSTSGVPHEAPSFLYIAFTDMLTIGNSSFVPIGTAARLCAVACTISGVILLAIFVARVLNLPRTDSGVPEPFEIERVRN
jgi:hypothetical protein